MKKSINFLLVALLAISSLSAGDSAQNKTNLVLRSQRNNAAAFTTFHNLINIKKEDHFDGYLEATSFYGQTDNGSELGKAFGANGSNKVIVHDIDATNDVNVGHILHLHSGTNTLEGTIKFDPKQIVYGTRFDYVQRFDWLVKGLYTTVNIPVLYIANDLNMSVEGQVLGGESGSEWFSLNDVLSGKELVRNNASNRQAPLAMAKIDGRQHEIGIGDIELCVGYRLWENKNSHLGVNAGAIFPTAKKSTGEYLWEPRLGYSKWGAIAGFDGSVKLWDAEFQKLMFNYSAQFAYLFEGTEKRTVGLNLNDSGLNPDYFTADGGDVLGHYYLIGEDGKGGIQPAANILTRDVDVEMGGKFDAIASIEYTRKKFTFDFGYNLFWKDDESVKVQTWTDDTYGIVDPDFVVPYYDEGGNGYLFDIALTADNNMSINKGDLDTTAAETPSYCSHKIFASLGYIFTHWEYPIMTGVGASYEISTKKNVGGEYYMLWSKIGVAF